MKAIWALDYQICLVTRFQRDIVLVQTQLPLKKFGYNYLYLQCIIAVSYTHLLGRPDSLQIITLK